MARSITPKKISKKNIKKIIQLKDEIARLEILRRETQNSYVNAAIIRMVNRRTAEIKNIESIIENESK